MKAVTYFSEKCTFSNFVFLMILSIFLCTSFGCKKLVDVDAPDTSINEVNVFKADATAASVLTGIYTKLSQSSFGYFGLSSISFFSGLSGDELTLYKGINNVSDIAYYHNALTNANTFTSDFWLNIYPIIFVANSAIDGVSNSPSLTPSIKQQLLGEAKFIRAFCYFYLVNLYGDVPMVTTTDFKENSSLSRSNKNLVWSQIIADLNDAKSLLSEKYLDADMLSVSTERVRPTKWAATALIARAYLYTQKWDSAVAASTEIINNSSLFYLNTVSEVFLKNSTEAIWQLQPVIFGQNTPDAWLYIIPLSGPSNTHPVFLSDNLINSFEANDRRRANWIDSVLVGGEIYHFAYKYKSAVLNASIAEYEMVFRLAEQYLIRAEARSNQGDLFGGASDLNMIRNRAGLVSESFGTQGDLLSAIQQERRSELFTEWGHRWLDLKRTSLVDSVMNVVSFVKGTKWSSNWQLYPISLSELQKDSKLVQNEGY